MRRNRAAALLLLLLLNVSACDSRRNRAAERLAEDSAAAQEMEGNLTLENLTLEQSDDRGQVLWQIKAAEAVYSPDQETAEVRSPDGELYQDGEPVYRVRADRGRVQQNGEKIELTGNIVATDLRSGAVLKGNELEWLPEQDQLTVRNNLTGTHPQVRLSATEARLFSRDRRMELSGQVIAVTRDPSLRLDAERLTWHLERQTIVSDRPAQVQRLSGRQVTGQARSNRAEVNLAARTVDLRQNGQLILQDPPIQIVSNALLWNLKNETLNANQPVTVVHRQQQVTVTADRGRMNLTPQIIYLTENVQAIGQRNRSQLNSDALTWNVKSQEVTADGSVVYTQANPPLNLRGSRAVGRLQSQTLVLSGGSDGGRVETQIIPGG
jgi:LPS export ABC transporter protein LptC